MCNRISPLRSRLAFVLTLAATIIMLVPFLAPSLALASRKWNNRIALVVTSRRVELRWSAFPDRRNRANAYVIRRNGKVIGSVDAGTLSYVDEYPSVQPKTTYVYKVVAVDADNHVLQPYHPVRVETPADADHEQPPSNEQPPSVPGGLTAVAVGISEVDLAWAAATDDVGVASYLVYRDGTLLASVDTGSVLVNGRLHYVDTSAQASTRYSYRVVAVDTAGNLSLLSPPAMVQTPAPPETEDTTPPSSPGEFTATAIDATTILLDWYDATDDTDVTAYRIYRDGQELATVNSGTRSFQDTSVQPDTTYTYTIEAFDVLGQRSLAASATTTTPVAPEP